MEFGKDGKRCVLRVVEDEKDMVGCVDGRSDRQKERPNC